MDHRSAASPSRTAGAEGRQEASPIVWADLPVRVVLAGLVVSSVGAAWWWGGEVSPATWGAVIGVVAAAEVLLGLSRLWLEPLRPRHAQLVFGVTLAVLVGMGARHLPLHPGLRVAGAAAFGGLVLGASWLSAALERAGAGLALTVLGGLAVLLLAWGPTGVLDGRHTAVAVALPILLGVVGLAARALTRLLVLGVGRRVLLAVRGVSALIVGVGVAAFLVAGPDGRGQQVPPGWPAWRDGRVAGPLVRATDAETVGREAAESLLTSSAPTHLPPWKRGGGEVTIEVAEGGAPDGGNAARLRFGSESAYVLQPVTGEAAAGRAFVAVFWLRSEDPEGAELDLFVMDDVKGLAYERRPVRLTTSWVRHELTHRFAEGTGGGDVAVRIGNDYQDPDPHTVLVCGVTLHEVRE